jgi:hypothetical protein
MALAKFLNDGTLYPPPFDGRHFGGTRFMPLQIVLNAAAGRVSGEYLVSGKLVSYAGAVVLFVLTFAINRRISGSWPLALALVGAILVTYVGFAAVHGIHGDSLPAALQLGAVTLALRGSPTAIVAAGVLCALAFLSKLSAIWAFLAIAGWLSVRARRRLLPIFFGASILPAVLLVVLFQEISSGRMSKNLSALSGAGLLGLHGLLSETSRRFTLFEGLADVVWLLLPLCLAWLLVGIRRRQLTIYQLAFVAAFGVLVVVLTDVGAGANHLLDIAVLSTVLVAELWRQATVDERLWFARIVVAVTLVWGIAGSYQISLRGDTIDAARKLVEGGGRRYPAHPLAGVVTRSEPILSEDPYIPVSLGQDPTILDAFMLLRLLRDHPQWQAKLITQIEDRAFTKVILIEPLDPTDPWFRTYDFGAPIASALARNYRLSTTQDGYWVYVPSTLQSAPTK